MSKTQTTTTTAAELRPLTLEEEARPIAEAHKARWKADEERRLDERAMRAALAEVRLRRQVATFDDPDMPALWQRRLARHGLWVILDVWPDCPIPRIANGGQTPTDGRVLLPSEHRPIVADSYSWRLDQQGIWRNSGYWVSSPVFQTRRGANGRPNSYAVLVKDTWRIVDIASPTTQVPDQWSPILNALIGAGLTLNSKPVVVDTDNEELPGGRDPDGRAVQSISAAQDLVRFLEQHKTEVPMYS